MKKIAIALFAALVLAQGAFAQTTVGIGSAQKTGTNYPMVEDIVRVCSNNQVKYENVVTDGALDNIFKIYGDKHVQYGVIDEAALVYQQGLDPKMMERIVMVFPFFSMELNLVVRDNSPISSINDLAGRKVYEGAEGSSTWVSTQVVKGLTGIKWDGLSFSQTEAMDALKSGKVDALFVVAGTPVGMLTKATGVRLVSINNAKLDAFGYYTKTMIPNGTYAFQKSSATTYKVNNVIATFAYKNQYQAEIAALVTCITHNLGDLQRTGHPKWRDVDPLDIERIKWAAHPAAVKAIKKELSRQ